MHADYRLDDFLGEAGHGEGRAHAVIRHLLGPDRHARGIAHGLRDLGVREVLGTMHRLDVPA